jgi:Domain of Unknown Function (DUF748)
MHLKKSKSLKIVGVIILILILIRVALPYIVLHFANKNLAAMKGYYGHIKDIDLFLIGGAYTIDSIYLQKRDATTQRQLPFFASQRIDLSIEWRSIFHGSLVGELIFDRPTLLFTKDKVEPNQLRQDSTDFKKLLNDFMPLRINRVEIRKGIVRYRDEGSTPLVDVEITNMSLLAQNLRNSYDSSTLLPAKVTASASLYEGDLSFNMHINPLANAPTFDLNTEIKNTNLVKLNDFFQAYAKIDVNKGTFGMYTEVAAKEGKFTGYVKPIIKNLDVLGKEDRKDNILRKLWEATAGAAGQVFKNQSKDQIATKIPFEGNIDKPNTNVWFAIMNILRNAFIQALQPSIDNEINIAAVDNPKKQEKTFLQKVFGKKNSIK